MMGGEVIGGELCRNAAPAEGHSRADHRDLRVGAPERAQQIRQHARHCQADEHQQDRQLLPRLARVARGGEQPRAEHAEHDRDRRQVLVASRVLAEHPLAQEQQHEQPCGERRLHHHQGREQQRHDLQRPAENRQSRADQPAGTPEESLHERQSQVLVVGSLLGVHRLEGDP